ncbi:MAG: signal peptidase II [Syntrophomonadaceae bacterium]|nr:signal peptidase II [Syntrophomonadaceae bacterium]MDD3889331.1 signal peptidase II [Syntrophomonadaceae bacterium]
MRFWLTMLAVLAADQLSKWWITTNFSIGESRTLIDKIIYLTYVQNRGAAFGILPGHSWIFVICALLVVVGVVIFVSRYKIATPLSIFLGLIVGGALGNFIDRWFYGFVIDFFDLRWWPVFNIADIAIICGGILVVLYILLQEKGEVNNGR